MCACDNLCSGVCAPTGQPTSHPTTPSPTLFSFGVKIGNEGILSSGKAIVVDYLQDIRRGESDPSVPSFPPSSILPSLCLSLWSVSFRKDDSHLLHCQLLSSLLRLRPSVVIGFHSHQMAPRVSSVGDRILGVQPHDPQHSWRSLRVVARESLE
jgi:hypothetical protein